MRRPRSIPHGIEPQPHHKSFHNQRSASESINPRFEFDDSRGYGTVPFAQGLRARNLHRRVMSILPGCFKDGG